MSKHDCVGETYRIAVTESVYGYARVVRRFVFDVYLFFSETSINLEEVVKLPIAFTVYVHVDVFKKSDWLSLGKVPLSEDELQRNIIFFKQDIKEFDICVIVDVQGKEYKTTPEKCVGIERLAVWDFEHVEERLRNIYLNKKDVVVEGFKVKFPPSA